MKKDEIVARQMTLAEQTDADFPTSSQDTVQKYRRMTNLLDDCQNGALWLLQLVQGMARNLAY